MNLQSKKRLANKIRLMTERLEREMQKNISNSFKILLNDFDKSINKKELFEIDYTNFRRSLKRNLFDAHRKATNRVIGWTKTLFGWNLSDDVIQSVRNESMEYFNDKFAGEKVTRMEQTTKDLIGQVVKRGQKAGLNVNDIADNIRNSITGMSKSRSKTIARTETQNSVNRISHIAAKNGIMVKKTWLHIGAGFEDRKSHVELDGKTIPMNSKFNVNGYPALYPHDPSLPASEIVNCHCLCIYE